MKINSKFSYYAALNIFLQFALVFLPVAGHAVSWTPTGGAPYYFGPEGRPIEDVQEYAKPNAMVNILPNRPVAAKDKYGNRLYFTPSGKLSVRISQDGRMEFSLRAKTKEKDAEGNLVRETEVQRGTNKVVTKNEKGEVLGYQELGLGGKVINEYDNENNLKKTYHYNRYGKSVDYILDELSQSRTVFDRRGRASYDVDFEGNRVAAYHYDDKNYLKNKVDVYNNKTYFDKKGNMTHSEDARGNAIAKYNYQKDDEGHWVLESIEDPKTGSITLCENGKQTVTKNYLGAVTKEYQWDGSKLVFSFDCERKETTWYDIQGRPTSTAYNEVETARWIYHKGKLVGVWDQATGNTLVFKNQREDIRIETGSDEPPTGEQIQKWIDGAVIDSLKTEIENRNRQLGN